MRRLAFLLATFGTAGAAFAGPFNDPGIAADDARFVGWATGFQDLDRGPIDASNPSLGHATFGAGSAALGAPGGVYDVVTLGDGGRITLTFDRPIVDGPGADFAVFENGFANGEMLFAELAFVAVSSNGVDFARFASVSETPVATQVGAFGTLDPTNVSNLAGKHAIGEGTGFDLATLANLPGGVDVSAIRYVRITDVVGSIDPTLGTRDSRGVLINDPFTTPYDTGGFDLNAVGVINVPEPTTALAFLAAGALGFRRRVR
ncbi:MAG: hypothetical protein JWR85_3953 [Marmoricola sp.]|nr:hypothetical protein [Marmoricola sp.]